MNLEGFFLLIDLPFGGITVKVEHPKGEYYYYTKYRPQMNFLSRSLSLLDRAPQDVNREEFQLERLRLQAFISATDPGCKKKTY
ncbi:hypothetical protein TNCV_2415151 [Trichonephila clavipes]|nr:hypothetical protein TNCV_2415151 [Trichonephila clavipes]